MRRPIKKRASILPDHRYNSLTVNKFINYVMQEGKKNTARTIVYGVLDAIKEKQKTETPLEIMELAFRNAAPALEVRSRRIGGATYQVPREVRPERRQALAMRWIIEAASGKKGAPMKEKLYTEIIAASKNEGEAIKKKENTHKMAEANRAFAYFSW
jgi:small subunit ribosomal protein S7